jgi:curved DNA-binding protein
MFFGNNGMNLDDIFSGRGNFKQRDYATKNGPQFKRNIRGEDKEVEIKITVPDGLLGAEKHITLETPHGRKTLSVSIPKGIQPGGKIRLGGLGGKGVNKGEDGDLFLVVGFKEDEYTLKGYDIAKTIEVMPWVAALGGEMMVKTPEERILVNIPAGIRDGGNIRIRGKGYYNSIGGRGDLFLKVNINNPEYLNEKQRALYQELKNLDSK